MSFMVMRALRLTCVCYRRGLWVEGIFRLSGGKGDVDNLKQLYDGGDEFDLFTMVKDVNVVASLLKVSFGHCENTRNFFGFEFLFTFSTAAIPTRTTGAAAACARV